MKKWILFGILILFIVPFVSSAHNTLMGYQGRALNSTDNSTIESGNLQVNISLTNDCDGTLYSETFVDPFNFGVYDLMLGEGVPLSLDYEGDYYMCTAINEEIVIIDNFRSGIGEIGPEDTSFETNMSFWNEAYSWGDHGIENYLNESTADNRFLNLSGTNANQNINVSPYNFSIDCINFGIGEPICWNDEVYTLNVPTGLGNTIQVGQELTLVPRNTEGSTIYAGQVVYASPAVGERQTVKLADASNGTKVHATGVVTIPSCQNNADCPITAFGEVHDLDTSAWAEGDVLYISDDGSGNLTNVAPTFPSYHIHVGEVLKSHATAGVILVYPEVDVTDGVVVNSLSAINNITSTGYFIGDGSLLTGITSFTYSDYFNQDLNTTSDVTFNTVNISTGALNTKITGYPDFTSSSSAYVFYNATEDKYLAFDLSLPNPTFTCWNGTDFICSFLDNTDFEENVTINNNFVVRNGTTSLQTCENTDYCLNNGMASVIMGYQKEIYIAPGFSRLSGMSSTGMGSIASGYAVDNINFNDPKWINSTGDGSLAGGITKNTPYHIVGSGDGSFTWGSGGLFNDHTGGIALGENNVLNGTGKTAGFVVGASNIIEESYGIAMGFANKVLGGSTFGAFAIGNLNTINGVKSGALGQLNTVNHDNSYLFGVGITSERDNEAVLGYQNTNIHVNETRIEMGGEIEFEIPPTVDIPVVLTAYDAEPARGAESNIHGGLLLLSGADTISNGDNIEVNKGSGKIILVVQTSNDAVGNITVTGDTLDRNTGVITPADSSDITLNGNSVDTTSTDGNGNTVHNFTNAYITSKWYVNNVTLSTTTVDLTDVDVFHVSFEQFNDKSNLTLNTYDVNLDTTHANAQFDSYLYLLQKGTESICNVTNVAELHVGTNGETAIADKYWRLRRGNLNIPLDGSTDGVWTDLHYSNSPSYVEDVTIKIWATQLTQLNGGI